MTRRLGGLLVPVLALVAMVLSGTWLGFQARDGDRFLASRGPGGLGMMGGSGMMGPGWFGAGSGPVDGLSEAEDRAARFADDLGGDLRVGEVMRFDNHYYAELEEPDGTNVTEVLVDPRTGGVQVEFGPAMMWNARVGMMAAGSGEPRLSAEEASEAARSRLEDGTTLGPAEAFPGYYTMHTVREGQVDGMLSVNAVTGAVWEHTWHGRFVEMSEGG